MSISVASFIYKGTQKALWQQPKINWIRKRVKKGFHTHIHKKTLLSQTTLVKILQLSRNKYFKKKEEAMLYMSIFVIALLASLEFFLYYILFNYLHIIQCLETVEIILSTHAYTFQMLKLKLKRNGDF